jgi:hypothetical protein
MHDTHARYSCSMQCVSVPVSSPVVSTLSNIIGRPRSLWSRFEKQCLRCCGIKDKMGPGKLGYAVAHDAFMKAKVSDSI